MRGRRADHRDRWRHGRRGGRRGAAELPLPVAGIVSDAPFSEVVERGHACLEATRALGCELDSPFQTLAFLALSVIPSLKLTDRGLVDVDRFELVPLAVGEPDRLPRS